MNLSFCRTIQVQRAAQPLLAGLASDGRAKKSPVNLCFPDLQGAHSVIAKQQIPGHAASWIPLLRPAACHDAQADGRESTVNKRTKP